MAIPIPADVAAMQVIVAVNQPAADLLAITQRYSDQNVFLCMLSRIGCDVKERFRFLHDGFNTMESLVEHFNDDIDAFKKHLTNSNKTWLNHTLTRMRSFYTPVLINKLLGVLYYYHTAVHLFHNIPDLNLIDDATAATYGRTYNQNSIEKDNDGDIDKIELPQLNEAKDWTPFKEKFNQLLDLTIGAHKIPIRYVIDSTVRPHLRANATRSEVDTIDMEDEDLFTTNTVHFGAAYKNDNKLVWNLLANALLAKPGYNHISSFNTSKNGRAAWFALRTFYEGENYLKNLREVAFSKLHNTFYRGETNRYTFEKYINAHKEAHKMLQDAQFNNGLGMDNAMKVQYFRQGIKSEAGIEVALATSRSMRQYEDFDALISFLAAEIEHHKLRKTQLNNSNRRLAALHNSGGRGGRGGGGRGGRGGGKATSRGGPYPSKFVDGKKVEGRFYSKDEFSKMTKNQRTAVIELKQQHKQGTNDNKSATVSQVTLDDMITLGDAIVAGVQKASADNMEEGNDGATTAGNSLSGRVTANSGSVGTAFKNRMNNKRQKNT
jgi:hypothetical protein